MKYISVLALVAIAIAVGCGSTTNKAMLTALEPATGIGPQVICDSTNASLYWQRAQLWLAKHSRWKIQTATDVMIQTYNPGNYEPSYGFTAMKEPIAGGQMRITIEMVCGNALGCDPKAEDVRRAFLYYVQTGTDLLEGVGRLGGGIH